MKEEFLPLKSNGSNRASGKIPLLGKSSMIKITDVNTGIFGLYKLMSIITARVCRSIHSNC